MNRKALFPSWLSMLSLAVALFVPFGVGLIADTSLDIGNRPNIVQGEYGRFIPPDEWDPVPLEPAVFHGDRHESNEQGRSPGRVGAYRT